ncbi:MAG: hypothetical protein U0946_01620 [Patescibacteria group bacterium]|nr:hypothetical protein [Patescibacteria group bacterium]
MSFEPAQPISIITCDQCQGKGCNACDQLGVYGLQDDQAVGFILPDFIDLKARKFLKNIYLIKKVILISIALLILILAWRLLWP